MINLNTVALFYHVVEAKGFTAAAQRLGLSKQALSRSVAALEEELGVQLLERSTRSLRLTDAGARFHEHARAVVANGEAAERAARAAREAPRGVLRITASPLFGEAFLAGAVATYLARWPEVRVHVLLSERRESLLASNIDLAIRVGPLKDSSLLARRLGPARAVCCAAPRYLASAPPLVEPEDLTRHACIEYGPVDNEVEWKLRRGDEVRRVHLVGRLVVNSAQVAVATVLRGLGVMLIPTFLARPHLATGALVRVLPDWARPDAAIYAVHASHLQPSANLREMLRVLEESLSDALD